MRKEDTTERISVSSLAELDALVGKYLTGETPHVQWVDTRTLFEFESVEEAVESVNDPFFQQFVEGQSSATTVLMEVRKFRRYSSELTTAWELVAHLTHNLEPLHIWGEGVRWEAAFGNREPIPAQSAPVAVCLAALRARGIEVECQLDPADDSVGAGIPDAEVQSFYSRS